MTEETTTRSPRTPEEYEKIISKYEDMIKALAKLQLDSLDTIRDLVRLLTPEQRKELVKIGSLPDNPLIPPEIYR